jgi:hypothetical protein
MSRKGHKEELEARQQLEARLEPSEELLAFTSDTTYEIMTSHPYHLGLTAERLILLPLKRGKPAGRALCIWRENIKALKWSGLWARLKIKFGQDELDIAVGKGHWKKLARDLVDLSRQVPIPDRSADTTLKSQRQLQQAKDFQEIGFFASAQEQLRKKVETGLSSEADSAAVSQWGAFAEQRLALRVAAGFLFVNVGSMILLAGFMAMLGGFSVSPALVASVIVDTYFGASLWRGRTQWRTWAILRAVVGLIVFGLPALAKGAILDLLMPVSFSGALVLVLTGESKRERIWIAVAIYGVGYLGLSILSLVIGLLTGVP